MTKASDGVATAPQVGHKWQNWVIGGLLGLLLVLGGWYGLDRWNHLSTAAQTPDDLASLRAELLADPDSVRGNWLRTLNPLVKHVQGDLVWNTERQQGVMNIVNLPAPKNNAYYQLWIYDTRSVTNRPVSAGVLHVGAGREGVLLPVKADSYVEDPYKFVLELETPDEAEGQILLMVQP